MSGLHDGGEPTPIRLLDRFRDDNPFPALSRCLHLGGDTDGDPAEESSLDHPPSRATVGTLPDVVVVGAGLAGLTTAVGLARRGFGATVLERRRRAGGLLAWALPDWLVPRSLLRQEMEAAEAEGVSLHYGVHVGVDVGVDELRERYGAVVLSTGADLASALPGALDHLTFLAGDGPPVAGRTVEIRGTGTPAMTVARVALERGARRVTVCTPEASSDTVPRASSLAAALGDRARIRWQTRGIGGHEVVIDCWRRQPDLGYLGRSAADGAQGVVVDPETQHTVLPGLFAAGEVVGGPGTAAESIASGIRAARGVADFLTRDAA